MKIDTIKIDDIAMTLYSLNTVVVGSGAAGYNAADSLFNLGQKDIAIVTEGINMGTSRNAGSDKQTYYKLSLESEVSDSILDMTKTLFDGGSMHGDIALIESALSVKSFYKLVEIGVPFPHNRYGEYIGYKTDHDQSKRATSAGPLTSKYMTEMLQRRVENNHTKIFDGYRVVSILTQKKDDKIKSIGLVAINLNDVENKNMGLTLFNCTNIIYATGGPGGMYKTSVYPHSQTGASGAAFAAGASGMNLTESQYGIASVKFRWNLSGTYQQVIPRYISTAQDGSDEKEFLDEYFNDTDKMLNAIFLKGYQWPFDPKKIADFGSSIIDILVYNEIQEKSRRVYLDFMHNPQSAIKDDEFDFSKLSEESYLYLENSGALFGKPIDRLNKMNNSAVKLFKDNGIDLRKEYLEIAVCAQHNNGGLEGNIWWESNIKNFFPVGEVNATFGVYRPGGTALNSTQVGSYRAAQYIAKKYTDNPMETSDFKHNAKNQTKKVLQNAIFITQNVSESSNVFTERDIIKANMTKNGAHIRSLESCEEGIVLCAKKLSNIFAYTKIKSLHEYPEVFTNWDILITQYVFLCAIREYILHGGKSRGSYLIKSEEGDLPFTNLPDIFRFSLDKNSENKVCKVVFNADDLKCKFEWETARPIPKTNNWFERIWDDYLEGKIIE